jgi:hypothetical protein
MTTRYCHECSAKNGWLGAPPSSLTGSAYQLEKFFKHTVPPTGSGIITIFDDPSYKNYAEYSVHTAVSGSLEIDAQGKRNIVWVAERTLGTLFVNGVLQGGVDAVKIVLAHDSAKVHLFPTASAGIAASTCAECGARIAY